jgi:glutaminyl-peptide cyclotransferase
MKDFTNVIATLDPEAPRRMVIACHYDSLLKPEGFLGATDSAVPCAQMLNMAHTMSRELKDQKSQRPELTLQFIFFDGEEAFVRWTSTVSIYGSRALAKDWENKAFQHKGVGGNLLDRSACLCTSIGFGLILFGAPIFAIGILAMICTKDITNRRHFFYRIDIFVLLDLIGAGDMSFMKLESSTGDWYDRLVAIERNLRRSTRSVSGKTIFKDAARIPSGIEDDHIPFKRRGVPILHLISVPFPKAWHKMGNNASSLDFRRIGDLNKILRVFVAEYLHLQP